MNKKTQQKSASRCKRKCVENRSSIELNTSIVKVKRRRLSSSRIEVNSTIDKMIEGNLRVLEGRVGGRPFNTRQIIIKKQPVVNEGRIGGGGSFGKKLKFDL